MATKANIVVDQGATFTTSISIVDDTDTPFNLTGHTGAAQLRKHFSSTNATSFAVSLEGANGVISLSLTSGQTANLAGGRYVYDVEITNTSTNTVSRVVEGIVNVNPNVTR